MSGYSKTVRLRHSPDIHVGAALSPKGRPLVVLDSEAELVEDIDLTPIEAERLAYALLAAAVIARGLPDEERGYE
jgi:hypothetical protein